MKARIRANLGLVALVIGAVALAVALAVAGAWVMGDNQPVRWIETPVPAPMKVDQ